MESGRGEPEIVWENVKPDMAKRILLQGETYLKAQHAALLQAQNRAATSFSVFMGFGTAVLIGTLAQEKIRDDPALFSAGLATAIIMLAGSLLCSIASWPRLWHPPGSEPRQWWRIAENLGTTVAMGDETENYQERIDMNEVQLRKVHLTFAVASWVAISAPIVGFLTWLSISSANG